MFNDEAHQRFRLVRVEVIQHKNVRGIRLEVHDRGNVLREIGFGARRLNQRGFHFARNDVARRNQARGPLPDGFKFLPFDMPRHHRQHRVFVFTGWDPGHLITGVDLNTLARQGGRLLVKVTDRLDVLAKLLGIGNIRMQPIAALMRL